MKLTIEITTAEAKFLRKFCILRVTKSASAQLTRVFMDGDCKDDSMNDTIDDLDEAGPIYEAIRTRFVEAIAQAELETRS
jgi:hypothetical protein